MVKHAKRSARDRTFRRRADKSKMSTRDNMAMLVQSDYEGGTNTASHRTISGGKLKAKKPERGSTRQATTPLEGKPDVISRRSIRGFLAKKKSSTRKSKDQRSRQRDSRKFKAVSPQDTSTSYINMETYRKSYVRMHIPHTVNSSALDFSDVL